MIRRFGGSTSPSAQWPEEENAGDDEEDRFERMERLIDKAMKRMTSSRGNKKKGPGGGSNSGMSGSQDHSAEQDEGSSKGSE